MRTATSSAAGWYRRCYTEVVKKGKTSVQINVEVWTSNISIDDKPSKMADGLFVFVAIDEDGKPRPIPK